MKKSILFSIIIPFSLILGSCSDQPKPRYKKVVSITSTSKTFPVTVTTQSGGNTIQRGAGGAIIGGGVDYLLGGSGKGGAIVGGLIGAATTDNPVVESYTEMRTNTYYTITFNDSSKEYYTNYCYLSKGDSIQIYQYN